MLDRKSPPIANGAKGGAPSSSVVGRHSVGTQDGGVRLPPQRPELMRDGYNGGHGERAIAGDGVGVGDIDGRAHAGVSLRGVRVGGFA